MASGTRPLKNITEQFTIAANQLQPGELVKDDFFTLFEAVGALEIMDPKMDSGYIPPDETAGLDLLPPRSLKESEAIWIIDELLCLEITWLDGYPLSQTIFTSLHIDRLLSPDRQKDELFHGGNNPTLPWEQRDILVDNVLLAYCIAMIKCCQLASFLVQSQTYYEEEDFVTHLFGRELLPEVGSNAAVDLMGDALFWINQHEGNSDVSKALIDRCHLRLFMLETLAGTVQRWEDIHKMFDSIRQTHDLGQAVPDAFSEKVQRHLATSTPPRPMIEISFDEAHRKWKTLCVDCMAAYRLTSLDVIQSPCCLQRAVWAFAQSRHPSTLARAQMQELLFNDNAVRGVVIHLDLMLTDMKDLVLTGDSLVDPQSFEVEVTSDPRHICSTLLRDFMGKALDEYLNLFRMTCQNHCRTRRTFAQAIAIWDAIQQEADRVDGELFKHAKAARNRTFLKGRGPLLSWARYHTLCLQAWTIQLGFETEIYTPDELGRMYWHLSAFCAQRSALLDSMRKAVRNRQRNFHDGKKAQECAASSDFLTSLMESSHATRFLADALWKLYHLLSRLDILKHLKRDFAKPDLLYEARMKSFIALPHGYVEEDVPGPGDFEANIADVETHGWLRDFEVSCATVDRDVKESKTALGKLKQYTPEQAKYVGTEEEWKKEIKQMETTCVAVMVAVSQLKRFRDQHGTENLSDEVEVKCEKKYHEWWVVPLLKAKVKK